MSITNERAEKICTNLLQDILDVSQKNNCIKFFRKDITTMTMWLLIMNAHFKNKKISIESLARAVAPASKISKPSLRLILENAKQKGFIKLNRSQEDQRSWNIEPEEIIIKEFKIWVRNFLKGNDNIEAF
tara:strand:+ start:76 stop:465 length:390 start_codon:yes stop_codon:yes gene_type:complete